MKTLGQLLKQAIVKPHALVDEDEDETLTKETKKPKKPRKSPVQHERAKCEVCDRLREVRKMEEHQKSWDCRVRGATKQHETKLPPDHSWVRNSASSLFDLGDEAGVPTHTGLIKEGTEHLRVSAYAEDWLVLLEFVYSGVSRYKSRGAEQQVLRQDCVAIAQKLRDDEVSRDGFAVQVALILGEDLRSWIELSEAKLLSEVVRKFASKLFENT